MAGNNGPARAVFRGCISPLIHATGRVAKTLRMLRGAVIQSAQLARASAAGVAGRADYTTLRVAPSPCGGLPWRYGNPVHTAADHGMVRLETSTVTAAGMPLYKLHCQNTTQPFTQGGGARYYRRGGTRVCRYYDGRDFGITKQSKGL